MSRYILVPAEGGNTLSIDIPKGLVCNDLFDYVKAKVKDTDRLQWLIQQLGLNVITEDKDGTMMIGDKRVPNVNLRECLIDTCNNTFLEKHEKFYSVLRDFNVTF